jgi:hypothetical protein
MTTLIIICAIVGAVCLLGTFIAGVNVLIDRWQGIRPILPAPDRSTMRYAERMDELAKYRTRLEKQGTPE